MGRFYNCGQACLAIKRVYVFESVADEVIDAIVEKAKRLKVGRGDVKGTQMGPMHTAGGREEMAAQVSDTLNAGGELLAGGGPPEDPDLADGFFYAPTVVADPPHDSPMATEEVFGPALPIWRVARPRRGDRARQRLAVRARVLRLDERSRSAPARPRDAHRGRLHLDQLAHEGLRRAPVRRLEVERLRQGARRGGVRLLHRDEVGRARGRDVSDGRRRGTGRSLPPPVIPLENTFEGFLGLEWLELTLDSAHVRFEVRENLKQPLGLMHGGIYSAVAETVASVATVNNVWQDGYVGIRAQQLRELPAPDHRRHRRRHRDAARPRRARVDVGPRVPRRGREAVRARRRDDRGAAGRGR